MVDKKEKSIRGRMAEGAPNPVDVYVGKRIKLRRKILKMSQQQMAQKLGLTFQQVQKYEKGFNRVGASRLWDISRVLNVSMNFFFADMDLEVEENSPMMLNVGGEDTLKFLHEDRDTIDFDPMNRLETLELVRAYYKIHDRKVAKCFFDLIKSMARMSDKETKDLDDNR